MRETPAIQAVRRKRPRPVKVRRWGSVQWGMNHEATAKPADLPMVWDANHYRRMTAAEWSRWQAAKRNRYHDFG